VTVNTDSDQLRICYYIIN